MSTTDKPTTDTPAPEIATTAPARRRGSKGQDDALLARMSGLGATTTPTAPARPAATRSRRTTKATVSPEPAPSTPTAPTRHKAPRNTATAPPAAPTPPPAPRARSGRGSRGGPMPGEQPTPAAYPTRISLTTTPEQNRALDLARLDDGVDKTARIRAMIDLWQTDEKFRRRVDKAAHTWR